MATGLSVWLGSAHALYGTVSIATTGELLPCMYGCVASAFSPLPYSLLITLIKPQNFNWNDFSKEKLSFSDSTTVESTNPNYVGDYDEPLDRNDPRWKPYMRRWTIIAAIWSGATFFGHWVFWPLFMYAAKFTFSKKVSNVFPFSSDQPLIIPYQFYSAWLLIAIIWLWGTLFIAGFFPLIDGRKQIFDIYTALRTGKRAPSRADSSATTAEGTPASEKSRSTAVIEPIAKA